MERPLLAFYSYSHKDGRDRRHLNELLDALAESRRDKLIDDWDDRKIRAGQMWEDLIIDRARKSHVFLLVVTNRFIASDFCVGVELTIASALRSKRVAAIAPILAEEANWKIKEFQDIQVIMPFDRPVSRSPRDRAWTAVGQAVRKMAEEFLAGTYFADVPSSSPIPPLLPFTIGREQDVAIFESALRAPPPNRPFVCVITGEKQGQSELIKSLSGEDGRIRQALGLSSAPNLVAIPGEVWVRSSESIETIMNGFLTSQILPTPTTPDRQGAAASLAAYPGLSIVDCELSAVEWRECGEVRFKQFLSYWAGWPDLQPGRPMIVFLTIRAATGELEVPGGICLHLASITPESLVDWLARPEVARRFVVERLRQHSSEVFGSQSSIPMEEFAGRVLPLLRKFQL